MRASWLVVRVVISDLPRFQVGVFGLAGFRSCRFRLADILPFAGLVVQWKVRGMFRVGGGGGERRLGTVYFWKRRGLERAGGVEPPVPAWKAGVLPLNHARGLRLLDRARGVEPLSSAWQADVLPLNYARRVTGFHYTLGGFLLRAAFPAAVSRRWPSSCAASCLRCG